MNTKLFCGGWDMLVIILTFNDPLCSGHLWLGGGVVGGGDRVVGRHDDVVAAGDGGDSCLKRLLSL